MMKIVHYNALVSCCLALALAVLAVSCQKEDPDHPPLRELGEVITLEQLRALYTDGPHTFTEDISVYATVSMDQLSGNIYRAVFVEDETAGINVRLDFAGNISEGDSVRLSLKGTTLSSFNNMLQLDSVRFGRHFIRQGSGQSIRPETVRIPDILDGGYQAKLIRLEEVQFTHASLGRPWANARDQRAENRDLQDCEGNRIIVRTSGFADFAADILPDGNGSLVAVVSQFGNVWQLLIRHPDELDMEGERCAGDEPSGSGSFEDPYNVAYALANTNESDVWVEGYLVGVMETGESPFLPAWEPPFQTGTNLIIADNPEERNISNALIVQLPIGAIRNALNLADNPEHLGKPVKLLGDLSIYFSQPGMRNTKGYFMDGDGIVP